MDGIRVENLLAYEVRIEISLLRASGWSIKDAKEQLLVQVGLRSVTNHLAKGLLHLAGLQLAVKLELRYGRESRLLKL